VSWEEAALLVVGAEAEEQVWPLAVRPPALVRGSFVAEDVAPTPANGVLVWVWVLLKGGQ
jgi:hypothetical protein